MPNDRAERHDLKSLVILFPFSLPSLKKIEEEKENR